MESTLAAFGNTSIAIDLAGLISAMGSRLLAAVKNLDFLVLELKKQQTELDLPRSALAFVTLFRSSEYSIDTKTRSLTRRHFLWNWKFQNATSEIERG